MFEIEHAGISDKGPPNQNRVKLSSKSCWVKGHLLLLVHIKLVIKKLPQNFLLEESSAIKLGLFHSVLGKFNSLILNEWLRSSHETWRGRGSGKAQVGAVALQLALRGPGLHSLILGFLTEEEAGDQMSKHTWKHFVNYDVKSGSKFMRIFSFIHSTNFYLIPTTRHCIRYWGCSSSL